MEHIETYLLLFGIIVVIGHVFNKSSLPIPLFLVMTGMILSFSTRLSTISIDPQIILNFFLPLLIYQISAFASWQDFKKNFRAIAFLSIGHVLFITGLIAIIAHILLPQMGWALAFVLGAIISPPDDVAITSIAEKTRMPARIVTILEGEGLFNDATALILFRFAMLAYITQQFSAIHAIATFFAVLIGETLYGISLGYLLSAVRLKIKNPMLQLIASFLTPFIAYLPAVQLGGSGVLATAITGFVIGNVYSLKVNPEFRLVSRNFWPAIVFAIQSFLYLIVGLELRMIWERISNIPAQFIFIFTVIIILSAIVGRFICVFLSAYLVRYLFPKIRKKDPYPPWQFVFIVSWAGMRGIISLAAALAVPLLPVLHNGVNPRDLLVFTVFCVIIATLLVQGLTLPYLLKRLGVSEIERKEQYCEHLNELKTRALVIKAVIKWLVTYKKEIKDSTKLDEVNLRLLEYRMLKKNLKLRIEDHGHSHLSHDEESEIKEEVALRLQIIRIQRKKVVELWHQGKISLTLREKLLDRLAHQWKHLPR